MGLDTQTRYITAILGRCNSPLKNDFSFYYERLHAYLITNSDFYAFIGHDKDINDDGQPKFRHIHLVIILKDGLRPRLSTLLNALAKVCELPNEDIDIDQIDNITKCVRYLNHIDYPNKYQYDLNDINTNRFEELKSYFEIDLDNQYYTASYLINLIKNCSYSNHEILKQLGIKHYLKLRNVINDLIKEFRCSD